MKVILLLLTIFHGALNGQETVELKGVAVPASEAAAAACPTVAQLKIQTLMAEDKTINDIEWACWVVTNQKDKPV